MANWSYPDASLEDLLKMVKGFIDMVILASGYQSSGRLAHWDSHNIKNALQWALFLQDLSQPVVEQEVVQHLQGRNKTRGSQNREQNRSKSRGRLKDIECYHCGMKDHTKRFCRKLKRENKNKEETKEDGNESCLATVTIEDLVTVLDADMINIACDESSWVVVMRDLSSSDDYKDSLEELDAALCEINSNPYFPQGLAHISSKVLSKASEFMLEHLISVFPLRDEHLKALLNASVEMDYHMHQKTDSRSLNDIFETLMCNTSKNAIPNENKFPREESLNSLPNSSPSEQADDSIRCEFSLFTAQALERRQLSVSLISAAETGLNILSSGLRDLYVREDDNALDVKMMQTTNFMTEEKPIGLAVWNYWKSKCLSYLLDKRTIRLVSGASLVFSAPKSQWIQVFQRIDISSQLEDSLCEIVKTVEFAPVRFVLSNICMDICYSSAAL
ncbi:hypothetical protein MTR67_040847 [Solanum verrucosum]|uniref:CCHC-type domain-containing protein n=1 Tax=Solanum verrucosum TaxID=315347 RepID=A0AAF0ZPS0_SOLVR|nr:hypothetical protein MTR67_040847 [Solanum verrucosum]